MDTLSVLTRCVQDEVLRYLYVLSMQGSPRGVILAAASGVVGALLVAIAARGRSRPAVAGPLGTPVGSATSPPLSFEAHRLAYRDERRSA